MIRLHSNQTSILDPAKYLEVDICEFRKSVMIQISGQPPMTVIRRWHSSHHFNYIPLRVYLLPI